VGGRACNVGAIIGSHQKEFHVLAPRMTTKGFGAAGYDPVQRAEAWKRRVDREEVSICKSQMYSGGMPSAVARLDLLEHSLQSARGHNSVRGYTGRSGRSSSMRSSAAGSVGNSIAQAPRLGTGSSGFRTPLSARGSVISQGTKLSSRSRSSRMSGGSEATDILKAELEEETKRRIAAEEELHRLQSVMEGSARGSSPPLSEM